AGRFTAALAALALKDVRHSCSPASRTQPLTPQPHLSHQSPRWRGQHEMLISEIFYSIQGEGELTGVPSVFIRTSGCNLRCNWCDTKYASWNPEGADMPVDVILEKVSAYPANHVVLTGGEPMIAKGIRDLAR